MRTQIVFILFVLYFVYASPFLTTSPSKRRAIKRAAEKRRAEIEKARMKDVDCWHDNYNVGLGLNKKMDSYSKYYFKPICKMHNIEDYKREKVGDFRLVIMCIIVLLYAFYIGAFKPDI